MRKCNVCRQGAQGERTGTLHTRVTSQLTRSPFSLSFFSSILHLYLFLQYKLDIEFIDPFTEINCLKYLTLFSLLFFFLILC